MHGIGNNDDDAPKDETKTTAALFKMISISNCMKVGVTK